MAVCAKTRGLIRIGHVEGEVSARPPGRSRFGPLDMGMLLVTVGAVSHTVAKSVCGLAVDPVRAGAVGGVRIGPSMGRKTPGEEKENGQVRYGAVALPLPQPLESVGIHGRHRDEPSSDSS